MYSLSKFESCLNHVIDGHLVFGHPNFTSSSSPSSLAVTGLGAPLSSSVLKRCYISLQDE